MCLIIVFNPLIYAKACLNAISVWTFKILPVLFPFFILTRLIVNLSENKDGFMDKVFNKTFCTPNGSFRTYFLSVLSGYPMGAKLICDMYENKLINIKDAEKMLSFCSISGPMFMLGTVGVMMLKSYKAGLIILISNIIASLLNGLIYRGKHENKSKENLNIYTTNELSLSNCVYDSLISILMVGAYVVLSFLIIEVFKSLHFFDAISYSICSVFKCLNRQNVLKSVMFGFIEITCGILNLSSTSVSLFTKIIISSGLVGFGGFSIIMQSLNFLSKIKIPIKKIFLQKITQGILCIVISTILSILIL